MRVLTEGYTPLNIYTLSSPIQGLQSLLEYVIQEDIKLCIVTDGINRHSSKQSSVNSFSARDYEVKRY